jgi:hypothetical protein
MHLHQHVQMQPEPLCQVNPVHRSCLSALIGQNRDAQPPAQPPSDPVRRRAGARLAGRGVGCLAGASFSTNLLTDGRLVLVITAVPIVLVVLGVIFPAVWSRRPDRRRDARYLIRLLLNRSGRPLSDPRSATRQRRRR